jgi:crotonobetainyl-CoA:carnitine CoA-transferase CaiB-like acyl-CoA transferase
VSVAQTGSLDAPGTGPLTGFVVVDFTQILAGPYCTQLLGEAGATVIKVEPPGGEFSRVRGHKRRNETGVLSSYSAAVNRNKRSICLDLKKSAGRDIALLLIERADVVIENFAPGALARLGIDFAELRRQRPELVTCSISLFGGFESAGELASRKGLAIVAESESSFSSMQRHPDGTPVRLGIALGDMASATVAYGAIVTALLGRSRGGVGRHLDISMVKVLLALNSTAITGQQMESHELKTAGYGIFPAADGYLAIGVNSDNLFGRLARLMDKEWMVTDPRYGHYAERDQHLPEVNAIVTEWTSARTVADVVAALTSVGVPGGAVNTPADILESSVIDRLGYLCDVDDGLGGTIRVPGNPFQLTPPKASRIPAPGEHTDEILSEFVQWDAEAVTAARRVGAFGAASP